MANRPSFAQLTEKSAHKVIDLLASTVFFFCGSEKISLSWYGSVFRIESFLGNVDPEQQNPLQPDACRSMPEPDCGSQLGAAISTSNRRVPEPYFGKSIWSGYFHSKWMRAGAWYWKVNPKQLFAPQMDPCWSVAEPDSGKPIWSGCFDCKWTRAGD